MGLEVDVDKSNAAPPETVAKRPRVEPETKIYLENLKTILPGGAEKEEKIYLFPDAYPRKWECVYRN